MTKITIYAIIFSLFISLNMACVSPKEFTALQTEVSSLQSQIDSTNRNMQNVDEQVQGFDRKVEKYKADNDAAILGLQQYAKELYEQNAMRIDQLEQRTQKLEVKVRQLGEVAIKQVTSEQEISKKKKNAY